MDLGRKMEPSWHPDGIKNRWQLRKAIKKKTSFFLRKNHDFEGSGGRSWDRNSIKNPSKNEGKLGRPLGIDFSWIFFDFGGQDGAKLGGKIDKKSIQKGIQKQMPKSSPQEGLWDASWRPLGGLLSHGTLFYRAAERGRSPPQVALIAEG